MDRVKTQRVCSLFFSLMCWNYEWCSLKQYLSETSYLHYQAHCTHKPTACETSAEEDGFNQAFFFLIVEPISSISSLREELHICAFIKLSGLLGEMKKTAALFVDQSMFWYLWCRCSGSGEVGSQSRSSCSYFLATTSTAEGTKPEHTEAKQVWFQFVIFFIFTKY